MKHRKLFTSVLSMALAASSGAASILPAVNVPIFAEASTGMEAYGENMALHKTAVASSIEANSVRAELATDGDSTNHNSRWGSNVGNGPDWIYVDLGEAKTVGAVRLFWENRKATAYKIQTATENPGNESSWTTQKTFSDRPKATTDVIDFDAPVNARYVRLYVDSHTNDDPDGGIAWNTVSIYEMEVYGAKDENYQDPSENVALNKTAVASSEEADTVLASNATDGDSTSHDSRWGSDVGNGPDWIYVDLGKDMDVSTVRLFWENRKATSYKIQTATDGADPAQESAWTDQKTLGQPASTTVKVKLDSKVRARYVRVYIDSHTAEDPDGGVEWNTVSLYEIQIFGGEPKAIGSVTDIANAIEVAPVAKGDAKVNVTIPEYDEEGFEAKYTGTDLEQVVDADLNIHQPVVDKAVKLSFKITNLDTGDYQFKEIPVTIPGKYQAEEGDNAAPVILPELQEWKGHTGSFAITENTGVYYADDTFAYAANALSEDYKEMTGKALTVTKQAADASVPAGSIVFAKVDDAALGKEGYAMNIGDTITIDAKEKAGAYYATRSILQAVMTSEDGSIPKGETRDYPTMSTRSFMLDVGRKTFTLDYVKQMAKAMSWYKYNDFQVHLNDNYIQVNQYWHVGEEREDRRLTDVYAGFRMESDIKKGGNGGKNQADLTSSDVFYTKADFNAFINESKEMGMTIVPEFDMPAHALSMTRVRPDLRSPDSDLPNQTVNGNRSSADHLDLNHQYEDVIEFVHSIWDEYTKGTDRVFDTPIIHIGADEYEAGSAAYRKYVNDMFAYAEANGYKPRVWGSLTMLSQGDEVLGYKVNEDGTITRRQIDIWNTGWANAKQMYDLGFELINIVDGAFYIVPNATYYYDYLGDGAYTSKLNQMGGVTIPLGDEQMTGASFAVWNDMCFDSDNGMTEYDIYKRIINSLGLFGANMWGKGTATVSEAKARTAVLNDIPGTNFGYEVEKKDGAALSLNMDSKTDATGLGNNLADSALIETVDGRKALKVDGTHTASIEGIETAGLGNSLRVKVKRMTAGTDEQVLFESPYGKIQAVQGENGKVGLYRENRELTFDYSLPVGEWTELEFRNEFEKISLYVNGELVDSIGETARGALKGTMMFPVSTVGSTEHPFVGYVDDIRLGTTKEFAKTSALDSKLAILSAIGTNKDLVEEGYALTGEYDPDAAAVAAMIEEVDAVLAAADYEKADYSEVDAYLALVPENLDAFTADSAQAVERAVNAVTRNLPEGMQNSVDLMASSLHDALDKLTAKPADSAMKADQSKMTATASSAQVSQEPGPASNAIDGDKSTMWHTDWDITTMPHWLNIEFDEPTCIDQVLYTPRSGAGNGTATAYQIQVSDDGVNYTTVKTGTLTATDGEKTINLDSAVTTKNVKFVLTTARNNNGSCAEINFRLANVEKDTAGLQEAIDKAGALKADNFTPESWAAVQEKLEAANTVKANDAATAIDVINARNDLNKALASLVVDLSEPQDQLDYTMLNVLIADMTEAKLADIKDADALKTQLDEAKAIVGKAKNQRQIDSKTRVLHASWLAARNVPDKAKLN